MYHVTEYLDGTKCDFQECMVFFGQIVTDDHATTWELNGSREPNLQRFLLMRQRLFSKWRPKNNAQSGELCTEILEFIYLFSWFGFFLLLF